MALILIVDDVAALAEQYAYDLRRLADFETVVASGGQEALEILRSEPVDCMILDLEMPGMDGFQVLGALEDTGTDVPVIVYTGTGSYERCVQAVKLGAFGFVDKAESMPRVVREVENALEMTRLSREVRRLRTSDSPLAGSSPAMGQLKDRIARLAPVPSPVLITGESGSGKELVARELHRLASADPSRPFVALNAGALPDTLVESELFGHERGAFTGADRLHRGAFERAVGGTLFLDEIGELPASAQAKLLRVLETRRLVRVGGEREVPVTARVVAATHRDLAADSEEGRFRTDLLYRLNVHVLRVPPLRERTSDIPELARLLLTRICRDLGIAPRAFSRAAMDQLCERSWSRNNVRELRNAIERMVIATDSETIQPEDGDSAPSGEGPSAGRTFAEQKAEAERSIIVRALERNDGHVSQTAQDLGLSDHASLLKIMRRLGIVRT